MAQTPDDEPAGRAGWNINTLRLHFSAVLAEMDQRYRERFAEHQGRVDALDRLTDAKFVTFRTLIDSQDEKVSLALSSADKAVSKAEAATERRFEGVNEFRATLSDQAATFITRVEWEAQRKADDERSRALSSRVDKTEGRTGGAASLWGYLVAAAAVVVAIVSLVTR